METRHEKLILLYRRN